MFLKYILMITRHWKNQWQMKKRVYKMEYQDWKLLATLDKTKNITHAADKLYVSQSTLSSRLKRLESHYGVQIVLRRRRGVTFTPEGIILVKYAKRMIDEQNKMKEKINNMKSMVTGTLKVGVSNFFALNKMPKLLRLFQQEHPGIECQVVTGWSSEMYRLLLNHDVHIGFIKGDYSWRESKEMLYEENICVAAPWPFKWEELPSLPRIDYHTDPIMKSTIDRWWYDQYKQAPYTNIYVNQVETCKEMILNKLGYGILAQLVVEPFEELTIKPLLDASEEPLTRKTWMYYHTDALQLNIVEAFTSFVSTVNVKEL